jgi:hypothetical protein
VEGTQEADSGVRRTPLELEEVMQERFCSDARVWLASMQGQPMLPVLAIVVVVVLALDMMIYEVYDFMFICRIWSRFVSFREICSISGCTFKVLSNTKG